MATMLISGWQNQATQRHMDNVISYVHALFNRNCRNTIGLTLLLLARLRLCNQFDDEPKKMAREKERENERKAETESGRGGGARRKHRFFLLLLNDSKQLGTCHQFFAAAVPHCRTYRLTYSHTHAHSLLLSVQNFVSFFF